MIKYNLVIAARFFHAVFYKENIGEIISKNDYLKAGVYSIDDLQKLLVEYFPECNHQQFLKQIDTFICSIFEERYRRTYIPEEYKRKLDFYDLIFLFSKNIMIRYENQYCFRYEYTDIWRDVTKEISEDLFVHSFIVQDDISTHYGTRSQHDMDWPYCVEHDNHALHMMLKRDEGVSENHFHLRGSSPYFETEWVYLMNDIEKVSYEKFLEEIEAHPLNSTDKTDSHYPFKLLWRIAAAIRVALYLLLKKCDNIDTVEINEFMDILYKEVFTYKRKDICTFPIRYIQQKIELLNTTGTVDYAQTFREKKQKYFLFSGERWIIYHSLKSIYKYDENDKKIRSLLLLYLKIKHKFFSEIVQSNRKIGFYNFNLYQSRKDGIIPQEDERLVASSTICSIIDYQKIYRIELRISPESSVAMMNEWIHIYDNAINDALERSCPDYEEKKEEYLSKFFYTLHFVKKKEKDEEKFSIGQCRHKELRDELWKKAKVISELPYSTARRIYGIDACGEEMDCRPEVFASVFRYLQFYLPPKKENYDSLCPQLRATFHVGEDNYDVLDGLRAIDEAVVFLNMRSGCRLGHATLLGISPQKYYTIHKNTVSMPRQLFLDNIVWLYYFLKNENVPFSSIPNLQVYLEDKFNQYFDLIFRSELFSSQTHTIMNDFYKNFPIELRKYDIQQCSFDITHYAYSWLLRGDEPHLYQYGFFDPTSILIENEEKKICQNHKDIFIARNSFEANYLYYLYHYDVYVKQRGMEPTVEELPENLIAAISLAQQKLKEKLFDLGISIETNPSSNVFISIINSYDEHPIRQFYNHGLDGEKEFLLDVSINTDDKSVFSTTLGNEYAYLLYYLEHQTDESGNRKCKNPKQLMGWLDEIRKMGNEQSFAAN